jgi:hypothetical protein
MAWPVQPVESTSLVAIPPPTIELRIITTSASEINMGALPR